MQSVASIRGNYHCTMCLIEKGEFGAPLGAVARAKRTNRHARESYLETLRSANNQSMVDGNEALKRKGYRASRAKALYAKLHHARVFGELSEALLWSEKERVSAIRLVRGAHNADLFPSPLCLSTNLERQARVVTVPWLIKSRASRLSDNLPIAYGKGERSTLIADIKALRGRCTESKKAAGKWSSGSDHRDCDTETIDNDAWDSPLGGHPQARVAMTSFDMLHIFKGVIENMLVKVELSETKIMLADDSNVARTSRGDAIPYLNERLKCSFEELRFLRADASAPAKALACKLKVGLLYEEKRAHFEYAHCKEMVPLLAAAVIDSALKPEIVNMVVALAKLVLIAQKDKYTCADLQRARAAQIYAAEACRRAGEQRHSSKDKIKFSAPKLELLLGHWIQCTKEEGPVCHAAAGNTSSYEASHKLVKACTQDGGMHAGSEASLATLRRIVSHATWRSSLRSSDDIMSDAGDEAPKGGRAANCLTTAAHMQDEVCHALMRLDEHTSGCQLASREERQRKGKAAAVNALSDAKLEQKALWLAAEGDWRIKATDNSYKNRATKHVRACNAVRIKHESLSGVFLIVALLYKLRDTYETQPAKLMPRDVHEYLLVIACPQSRIASHYQLVHELPDIERQQCALVKLEEVHQISVVYLMPLRTPMREGGYRNHGSGTTEASSGFQCSTFVVVPSSSDY